MSRTPLLQRRRQLAGVAVALAVPVGLAGPTAVYDAAGEVLAFSRPDGALALAGGRSRRVSTEPGWYSIGTAPWAPDGARFTFTRRAFLQAPGGEIHVAAPREAGSDLVARGAREAGAWSPDGARLAFNVGGDCKIRVVTLAAGSAEDLAFPGCRPTWRPPPR